MKTSPNNIPTATQPASFYAGRRVLVTGHSGFKGSWLCLWLKSLGAEVHGFALPPEAGRPSLFQEARVSEVLSNCRWNDIRDPKEISKAVAEVKPEIVFHLAAQPLVRRSHREPRETFETNVMGTVNLLDAVRTAGAGVVRVCQVITSDKCYENHGWVYAYRENDAMGGADPYSASKGCAELVVSAYRHSFFPPAEISRHGVSLASGRAGNVIGGGDWAEDRIIPDCIRSLSNHEAIPVRNPNATRPWQHVLEPLAGYLLLAARQWENPVRFADGWNFGPVQSNVVPVREVVELALKSWGSGSWADRSAPGHPHEAHTLRLDVTKSASQLRWWPVLSVREAVAATIDWYRGWVNGGGFDAKAACMAQIQAFETKAKDAGLHLFDCKDRK